MGEWDKYFREQFGRVEGMAVRGLGGKMEENGEKNIIKGGDQ